ncbi:MAG: pirin family protein [Methylotenera sp.]|nr:pirin family protein [Methylotenera sp.]
MMQIRTSEQRGHANHGWLDSYHSFSFADYYDQNWMNYSVLRVINEDVIAPAMGFGMHSHDNMEIITYVLQGNLAHKDSLGNTEVIRQGHVQRMTAGTGIRHSEFNASDSEPIHLLQIWILPNLRGLPPSYEDKFFTDAQKLNQWCLLASENGANGSMLIHQDMRLYAAQLSERNQIEYVLRDNRCVYLQVASGSIAINQKQLSAGDAAMFDATQTITLNAVNNAEILLFDLPKV